MNLIAKEFLILVMIAVLVAFPIAWWAMHNWLGHFAFRTNMDWWVFSAAGTMILLTALGTVAIRAINAANTNPVNNLRAG